MGTASSKPRTPPASSPWGALWGRHVAEASATRALRIAVIGVGHLGKHHARILGDLPGAQLVAVVDPDTERATAAASASGAKVLADYRAVLGDVDAVTVATPT